MHAYFYFWFTFSIACAYFLFKSDDVDLGNKVTKAVRNQIGCRNYWWWLEIDRMIRWARFMFWEEEVEEEEDNERKSFVDVTMERFIVIAKSLRIYVLYFGFLNQVNHMQINFMLLNRTTVVCAPDLLTRSVIGPCAFLLCASIWLFICWGIKNTEEQRKIFAYCIPFQARS